MNALSERLNLIPPKLTSDAFLCGRGLGNEVAFHIFDYAPEDELVVRGFVRTLVESLPKQKPGLRVKHVDLFDFVLEYLRGRKLLDKAIEMQRDKGDRALKKVLVAGPLSEDKLAAPFAALARPKDHDLIIVSGAGTVWPLLRVHSLLNNLHAVMGETPLVVFYPGRYDGQSLKLFGRVAGNNYYRGFRLVP